MCCMLWKHCALGAWVCWCRSNKQKANASQIIIKVWKVLLSQNEEHLKPKHETTSKGWLKTSRFHHKTTLLCQHKTFLVDLWCAHLLSTKHLPSIAPQKKSECWGCNFYWYLHDFEQTKENHIPINLLMKKGGPPLSESHAWTCCWTSWECSWSKNKSQPCEV